MDLVRAESEVIYTGHFPGRRLRGVKINPIYQENDNGRCGNGTDTQSDTSVPVGEIQIEMYESLPRHRIVRPSRSAPNLPHGRSSIPPGISFMNKDQEAASDNTEFVSETLSSSDFSLQTSSHETGEELVDLPDEEAENVENTSEENRRSMEDQTCQTERENRKQLTRQTGIDATADDPDVVEIAHPPVADRISSSSSRNTSSSTRTENGKIKRRATPRFIKPKNCRRKRQLSAVAEQSSFIENEEAKKGDDTETTAADMDSKTYNFVVPNNGGNNSCQNDAVNVCTIDESCLAKNNLNETLSQNNKLLSQDYENKNLTNNTLNEECKLHDTDVPILSSDSDILPISKRKAIYSLDKIAVLPSFSNIHNTSPAGSVDYINNNNETVPDLMLQFNGQMNGVSRNGQVNVLVKSSPRHDGEEYFTWDSQSLKVVYSLSNSSSIDSDNKSLNDGVTDCSCDGMPTLKCPCGRKALQKLLAEKHLLKYNDSSYYENSCKSVQKEITSADCIKTPAKQYTQNKQPDFNGSWSIQLDNDIDQITESPPKEIPEKKVHVLKSILHSVVSPKDSTSTAERKIVTFSADTVFNEDKGVVYLKECISPSDLSLLITELQDDDGLDNPAFEDSKEDGQISASKGKKKSKKQPKSKCKTASDDSIILKVSELNTPAYMKSYLNGVSGRDADGTATQGKGNKAPLVSIEAVAGTTFDDPSFDAIGMACDEDDDDFEEYRRRRKLKYGEGENVDKWLKKSRRRKKIKVCAIVVTVIVVVITGIALAIHFGAPQAGSGSTTTVSQDGSDLPRFPGIGIF